MKKDSWIEGVNEEMERKGTVGAFTKQAKRAGMSTVRFAKDVLSSPEKYSEKTRERAQFMKNVNPEMFSDGGEINRSYDVNINSGVGTYATGGVTEAGDVDFPSQMLNYAIGGNLDGVHKITHKGKKYLAEWYTWDEEKNGRPIKNRTFITEDKAGGKLVGWNTDKKLFDEIYNKLLSKFAKGGKISQEEIQKVKAAKTIARGYVGNEFLDKNPSDRDILKMIKLKSDLAKAINGISELKKQYGVYSGLDIKAKGGMTDVNEDGSNLPKELRDLFTDNYDDDRYGDYQYMEELRGKANQIGYDFDYDLSGTPTAFTKTMAKGGKIEAEWLVVLEDKYGYEIDEIVFAKSEDEAYNKAEKLNPNSNARGINMLTDYNGRKVEFAKGGVTKKEAVMELHKSVIKLEKLRKKLAPIQNTDYILEVKKAIDNLSSAYSDFYQFKIRYAKGGEIYGDEKVFAVNTSPIGKAKYSIKLYDGDSYKDGSPFIGIRIFSNKKDLATASRKFRADGYNEVKDISQYLKIKYYGKQSSYHAQGGELMDADTQVDYAKGGKTDYSKRTSDDFKLGELVYDTRNKTYGIIIGIYNNYSSDKYEVRLDSDGMQPTENLRKLNESGDKGTKKQLFEAVSSYENLRNKYPQNDYPKLINNPFYAKGGEINTISELYEVKKYEQYPYARDLVAHFIYGDDERGNLIVDATNGRYTNQLADSSELSDLMLGYENTWRDEGNMREIDGQVRDYFSEIDILDYYAKGGSVDFIDFDVIIDNKPLVQISKDDFIDTYNVLYFEKEKIPKSVKYVLKDRKTLTSKEVKDVYKKLDNNKEVEVDVLPFAKGGKTQGYNARLDESLAMRDGKAKSKKQTYKGRRDESKGENKAKGKRAYSSVNTMDKKVTYKGRRAKGGDVYDDFDSSIISINRTAKMLFSRLRKPLKLSDEDYTPGNYDVDAEIKLGTKKFLNVGTEGAYITEIKSNGTMSMSEPTSDLQQVAGEVLGNKN